MSERGHGLVVVGTVQQFFPQLREVFNSARVFFLIGQALSALILCLRKAAHAGNQEQHTENGQHDRKYARKCRMFHSRSLQSLKNQFNIIQRIRKKAMTKNKIFLLLFSRFFYYINSINQQCIN